ARQAAMSVPTRARREGGFKGCSSGMGGPLREGKNVAAVTIWEINPPYAQHPPDGLPGSDSRTDSCHEIAEPGMPGITGMDRVPPHRLNEGNRVERRLQGADLSDPFEPAGQALL